MNLLISFHPNRELMYISMELTSCMVTLTLDGSSNDNVSRLCVDLAKSLGYDPVVTLSPNGSSDEAYFDIFPFDGWKIVSS
jgi:hypothetical protein